MGKRQKRKEEKQKKETRTQKKTKKEIERVKNVERKGNKQGGEDWPKLACQFPRAMLYQHPTKLPEGFQTS